MLTRPVSAGSINNLATESYKLPKKRAPPLRSLGSVPVGMTQFCMGFLTQDTRPTAGCGLAIKSGGAERPPP